MKKVWDSNLNLLFDILLSIRYYSILCGSYGRQNKLLFNEDSCVNIFSFSQQVEQYYQLSATKTMSGHAKKLSTVREFDFIF